MPRNREYNSFCGFHRGERRASCFEVLVTCSTIQRVGVPFRASRLRCSLPVSPNHVSAITRSRDTSRSRYRLRSINSPDGGFFVSAVDQADPGHTEGTFLFALFPFSLQLDPGISVRRSLEMRSSPVRVYLRIRVKF